MYACMLIMNKEIENVTFKKMAFRLEKHKIFIFSTELE